MLHSVHKRVFHLVDFQITGMLNAAVVSTRRSPNEPLAACFDSNHWIQNLFRRWPDKPGCAQCQALCTGRSSSVWAQRRHAMRFYHCAVVQATGGMRMGSNTPFAQGETQLHALKMLEDVLVPFLCMRPFWGHPLSRWAGSRPKLVRRRHVGINTQLIGASLHRLLGRRSWISFAEDEEFSGPLATCCTSFRTTTLQRT